ncbi:CQS_1a_G0026970.mRNA.1.CDS.1 [Saccharomyces cerevisiae]|nr:CQS_1a_G0026970.mRNA.1.CDS.1 [Saccharomyces cerevisiae]CAI7337884.1 CQS_1a_G0026970.mRNA.1.CDS.1 [Saccharomyces cerevisiae]
MSESISKFEGFGIVTSEPWQRPKRLSFEVRDLTDDDLDVKVEACGLCGSDMHCISGRWGPRQDPLIVGHEVVGRIVRMGKNCANSNFKVGQRVGTGAVVSSCRNCTRCRSGEVTYCEKLVLAFNGKFGNGSLSQGGFASHVRVNMHYVVSIPENIPSHVAAPLMCAGISAYAALIRNDVAPGKVVGVVGLGGVGNLAVVLAKSLGAEVYVFSRTAAKKWDALKMGADHFILTSDDGKNYSEELVDKIDLMLVCTSSLSGVDFEQLIRVMRRGGKIVSVAEPPTSEVLILRPYGLLGVSFECSAAGNFEEVKLLLQHVSQNRTDFCIETRPISEENIAISFNKMGNGDIRYRLVLTEFDKEFSA